MGLTGSPADGLGGLASFSQKAVARRGEMSHARGVAHGSPLEIPGDLRARLEAARLDLLALFRALDRLDLAAAEIPQRLLRQLFEKEADYAQALGALDQREEGSDRRAKLRDAIKALDQLPSASPVSETITDSYPSHLGTTGRQHPQETESQRRLQHGARQRSRKRLSTPT